MRKSLDCKVNSVFSMPASKQKIELLQDCATPMLAMDCFFVEMKQASRRWFTGDINVVIYQVEGSGGDILKQQHKMSLKEFKSTVAAHIPLQGRVKRTMQNKKKEFDTYMNVSSTSVDANSKRLDPISRQNILLN